jgi:DNA primase
MGQWINFKELRKQVDFEKVMGFYGIEIKRKKQDQHLGFCPLPAHKGKKNSASFSVNLAKGIFQCFGCGATGNVLDFVCRMEGLSPSNPQEVRKAAILIQEQIIAGSAQTSEPKKPADKPKEVSSASSAVLINQPLDFELKGLDPSHPYLKERGWSDETIKRFGLGYCARGLMQGRIVIPIHNSTGKLVGYAGRLVDDTAISEDNPKYRFPGERDRNGVTLEFRKSLLLYNHHRIPTPVSDLVVVEGFASVCHLYQHQHENVVAVMGASCSDEQADMIVELVIPEGGRVWILTDGDEAGERCAIDILTKVSPHRFCRWVKLDEGIQPTDLSALQLSLLFHPEEVPHGDGDPTV